MVKLTPAQLAWLKKAASHNGVGSGSVMNRTAIALEDRRFARRYYDDRGLGHWIITDAGRAALADSRLQA